MCIVVSNRTEIEKSAKEALGKTGGKATTPQAGHKPRHKPKNKQQNKPKNKQQNKPILTF